MLTLSSGASGSGGATVGYVAAPNTGAARSANLTIGAKTFVVAGRGQRAGAGGSIGDAHADGAESWHRRRRQASGTKNSTVKNTGASALTISALTMGGANPAEFTRKGTRIANSTLAPAPRAR